MKNLSKNSGVTLVELIVSLAILSLVATAIVGIMGSNTQIFRKNKADITIQSNAQEVYNRISEDIMQAKYIYVEGYICNSPITYDPRHVGEAHGATYTPVKMLKQSDLNLIDLAGATSCQNYVDSLVGILVTDRTAEAAAKRNALSDANKAKFDSFYNNIKNLESYEAIRYAKFIDHVKAYPGALATTFTPFDEYTPYVDTTDPNNPVSCLKKSDGTIQYGFHISRIVMLYTVPLKFDYVTNNMLIDDSEYDATKTHKYNEAHCKDYCVVDYVFNAGEVHARYDYCAMNKLDTDTSDPNNSLLSKSLNYDLPNISAVIGRFDAAKDSFELDMYFADRTRSYNDKGMTKMRNSYVLHDAK